MTKRTIERRAVEAAIWGMSIVSVHAMRQAFLRDAKANYNDIVYWSKPADWKCQVTTPTDTALYGYFNINTQDGPVVVEIPASVETGLWGGLMDAWQVAIVDVGPKGSDEGKGGKYLILPPDFKGDIPAGYFVVHSHTYNDYALLRFIPKSFSQADLDSAIAMIKKCRVYPLARASSPPEQRFIDMHGKLFDGIVRFDESYYAGLAEMINDEPVLEQDMVTMGLLLSLGVEKGKDFQPDTDTQHILAKAAEEAHTWLMNSVETRLEPFWTDSLWGLMVPTIAMASNGTFRTPSYLDVDARAITYFQVFTNSVVAYRLVDPKVVPATYYLATFRDTDKDLLRGEESYKLHVPADVPTKQFWSLTLYDRETCGLIRDMPRTGADSLQQQVEKNTDGSVDIYIGPKAPTGKEGNWIPTAPGRGWFPYFRLYGPEKSFFEKKRWELPAIERIN
ncbi:DUF1254 domain-containing protein [Streptomyces sp. NPDC046942]|uniref:DUF1254 domain-containing protein n=1 Tax=Streptomyces sp. NPDC046942 TaxID=3155137 RepID=UPI0033F85A8A